MQLCCVLLTVVVVVVQLQRVHETVKLFEKSTDLMNQRT